MQSQRPSGAWLTSVVLTAVCTPDRDRGTTNNGREFSGYYMSATCKNSDERYRSPSISSSSIMVKSMPEA